MNHKSINLSTPAPEERDHLTPEVMNTNDLALRPHTANSIADIVLGWETYCETIPSLDQDDRDDDEDEQPLPYVCELMFCDMRYIRIRRGEIWEAIDKPRFLTSSKGRAIMSIVIWKMADLFWADRATLDLDCNISPDWIDIFQNCLFELKRLEPSNEYLSGLTKKSKSKKVMFWFQLFNNTGYLYYPENVSHLTPESKAQMWVTCYIWQFLSPNKHMMDIKFFKSLLHQTWKEHYYEPQFYIKYGRMLKFKVEEIERLTNNVRVKMLRIAFDLNWNKEYPFEKDCLVKWFEWCPKVNWFRNFDDVRDNLLLPHEVVFEDEAGDDMGDDDMGDVMEKQQDVEMEQQEEDEDEDEEDEDHQDAGMDDDDDDDGDDDGEVAPIFDYYPNTFGDRRHAAPALPVGNISNWLRVPNDIFADRPRHYIHAVIVTTLSVLHTSICDDSMANKTHDLRERGNFIVFVKTLVVANICMHLMFTKIGYEEEDGSGTRSFTGVKIMEYHMKQMNGELNGAAYADQKHYLQHFEELCKHLEHDLLEYNDVAFRSKKDKLTKDKIAIWIQKRFDPTGWKSISNKVCSSPLKWKNRQVSHIGTTLPNPLDEDQETVQAVKNSKPRPMYLYLYQREVLFRLGYGYFLDKYKPGEMEHEYTEDPPPIYSPQQPQA
jgi:hypothetical protein